MHVVLTGASGFLGGWIARLCREAGYPVSALVRRPDVRLPAAGVQLRLVNFSDVRQLASALSDAEVLIHCAGGGQVLNTADFYTQNLETTATLLAGVRLSGASLQQFILISSLAAHGPARRGCPAHEESPDQPVSHYGRSKWMAEGLALRYQHHFPITILRPPALYGPGDRKLLTLFRQVQRGWVPVPVLNDQLSWLYGPDCAEAVLTCVRQPPVAPVRRYFLSGSEVCMTAELVNLMANTLNCTARLFRVPLPVLAGAAYLSECVARLRQQPGLLTRDKYRDLCQAQWYCSSALIAQALGWQAKTMLSEGVATTAAWYREQGWL
jgi:dihydroflavonol-4-reductase